MKASNFPRRAMDKRPLQAQGVAGQAAVGFAVGHGPEVDLGIVLVVLENDRDAEALGHLLHAFATAQIIPARDGYWDCSKNPSHPSRPLAWPGWV